MNYGKHIIISEDVHLGLRSLCATAGFKICDVADGILREEVEALKNLQDFGENVRPRVQFLASRGKIRPAPDMSGPSPVQLAEIHCPVCGGFWHDPENNVPREEMCKDCKEKNGGEVSVAPSQRESPAQEGPQEARTA